MYSAQVNKALSLTNNNHHDINPTLKEQQINQPNSTIFVSKPQRLSIIDNEHDTKIFPFTSFKLTFLPKIQFNIILLYPWLCE